LTESLFSIDPGEDDQIIYYTKIAGDFTLAKRAAGFRNVVFVGTGTGLAPFVAMLKQLNHEALHGQSSNVRYTLFHANRTAHELGYHSTLHAIQDSGKLDFLYVPTISRPNPGDDDDPHIGRGRANNVLRYAYGLPLREDEELHEAGQDAAAVAQAQQHLSTVIRPILPSHATKEDLRKRLDPSSTVILTCGNPTAMDDIRRIATTVGAAFEKEEW
jgi:ferredoxin-NADP reductase